MMANHLQAQIQQSNILNGPVAILWDIEYCPVPNGVQAENVAGNVRKALHMHPSITGAVTLFSAYGDFNAFSRRLREGCQRTGVKLVDVPNGRKFATDKAILVDMFLFALDNRPPASILLISGDADFSPALHVLGQRGYTVVVVVPAIYDVQSELSSAGRFLWDWPTVARGDGFIPPSVVPCRHEAPEYHISCQIADRNNGHIEEMLVRKEISRSKYSIPAEMGPVLPPEYAHNWTEFEGTHFSLKHKTSQGLQSNPTEVSKFRKNRWKQHCLQVQSLGIGKKYRKKLKMKQKKHCAPAKIKKSLYYKYHPVSGEHTGTSCSLAQDDNCNRVLSNPKSNEVPLFRQNGLQEHALPIQPLDDKKTGRMVYKEGNEFGTPDNIDSTYNHRHSPFSKKCSQIPPSEPSNSPPVENESAHVKWPGQSANVDGQQAKKRGKKKYSGTHHLLLKCSNPQSPPSKSTEVPPIENDATKVKLQVHSPIVEGRWVKKKKKKKNAVKLNGYGEPANSEFHFKSHQLPVESNGRDNTLEDNSLQGHPSTLSEALAVHQNPSEGHKLEHKLEEPKLEEHKLRGHKLEEPKVEEHSLDIIYISD